MNTTTLPSRSCRWLRRPTTSEPGKLVINNGKGLERLYEVAPVLHPDGRVLGYHVARLDNHDVYDVDGETWECTCADATYRERACKHSLALRAGLKAIGQG
jgi:hypothetical protein